MGGGGRAAGKGVQRCEQVRMGVGGGGGVGWGGGRMVAEAGRLGRVSRGVNR